VVYKNSKHNKILVNLLGDFFGIVILTVGVLIPLEIFAGVILPPGAFVGFFFDVVPKLECYQEISA